MNIAIIVASGGGSRAKTNIPKQYIKILNKPILQWSIEAFKKSGNFDEIIIAYNKEHEEFATPILNELNVKSVYGGETRAISVKNALDFAQEFNPKYVFIHDAARPGLDNEIIESIFEALENGNDGAMPSLVLSDAIWQIDENNCAQKSISRDILRRAQTPQAFDYNKLMTAYQHFDNFENALDDAQIAIAANLKIKLVAGKERLDKITFNKDFEKMEGHLANNIYVPKTGIGLDAHQFCEGEFVTLCGVEIPYEKGLKGHSDADAAWHALTDALLGAIGLGDIGQAFPPSDMKYKGAASSIFLEFAKNKVIESGAKITNVDVVIICEAPKIGPHREAMRKKTAEVLGINIKNVGIKATTMEKMGFTGRKEGIAAQAIATIIAPFE